MADRIDMVERVISALYKNIKPSVDLAFVPDAVRSLRAKGYSLSKIHEALYQAGRAEMIELRPESGLNVRTQEEMALSPPGPQGTRLTFARML